MTVEIGKDGKPVEAAVMVDSWGGPACGRIAADGSMCRMSAGYGTPHLGDGPCKWHDKELVVPTSGRYRHIKRKELRTLIEEHERDPQPLDMLPDLAAGRALFETYIDQHEQRWAALMAWYEAGGEEAGRPPDAPPAIGEARKMLAVIAKLTKTAHDIQAEGSISKSDFVRLMFELGRSIERHVSNKAQKKAIRKDWMEATVGL